jgi:hypothetical protein
MENKFNNTTVQKRRPITTIEPQTHSTSKHNIQIIYQHTNINTISIWRKTSNTT